MQRLQDGLNKKKAHMEKSIQVSLSTLSSQEYKGAHEHSAIFALCKIRHLKAAIIVACASDIIVGR